MALKYSDNVVLVIKSPKGFTRVNAIVIASATQPPDATRATGLRDHTGAVLPAGEYLDLAYPDPAIAAQSPKSRSTESIFRRAWACPPWKEGASIGWQPGAVTPVAPDSGPQPSADDLDVSAEEEAVTERTRGPRPARAK